VEAARLPWQHLGSLLINRGLLDVEQVKPPSKNSS
jgi:hypothetical protein